jgi:small conductance mechanosensitive channel
MTQTETFFDVVARVFIDYRPAFNVLFVFIGAIVLRAVLLGSVKRVVASVVSGVGPKGLPLIEQSPLSKARIVQRAKTIGSVLSNFITWGVAIVAVIMSLGELGVAVGGLIAGAGIIGAAIGFGAQSLVKDLISGLFLVFEDQLGVGDSVDVGEVRGVVELVGLRVTQVRDLEGTLWYVRNGEIQRVGNKSQGWARVVLDIALATSTDLEKTKKVLLDAAAKLKTDKELSPSLQAEAEVWGLQTFNGDEIVVRLVQQVEPKSQDEVARSLRESVRLALAKSKIELATSAQNIHLKLGK